MNIVLEEKTAAEWFGIYCMMFVTSAVFNFIGARLGIWDSWQWWEYVLAPACGTGVWWCYDAIRSRG